MSRFEFVFVLISIVAGLALTRLLSGLALSFRQSERKIDVAHILFSLGIVVLLFSIWWTSFRWEGNEIWTYLEYSLLCVYMSMFYVMAAILNPGNSPVLPRFNEVRIPFYVAYILYSITEFLVVYVRDGFAGTGYFVITFLLILLAAIGIYLRKIKFDQLLAAFNIFVVFSWLFFARWIG